MKAKRIFKFANILLCTLMLVGFVSCKDPSVDITYTLTCSENLLKVATPVVTYKANNGAPVRIDVPDGEWKSDDGNTTVTTTVIVNGETVSLSGKSMVWQKNVSYDDFSSVTEELTVTYEPKAEYANSIVTVANFPHSLDANVEIKDDDGHTHLHYFSHDSYNTSLGERKTLQELLSTYKDHVGFTASSDGTCTELK